MMPTGIPEKDFVFTGIIQFKKKPFIQDRFSLLPVL
jgi:hypothetical protein